jgi:hypothetical protein
MNNFDNFDDSSDYSNTWLFSHKDNSGAVTSMSFSAQTWPDALDRFLQFLAGAGYSGVDLSSVALNGEKHSLVDWHGEMFYPGEEQDCDGCSCEPLPTINFKL